MDTTTHVVTIRGDFAVTRVASERDSRVSYKVALSVLSGEPSCSCHAFHYNVRAHRDASLPIWETRSTCKHLDAVKLGLVRAACEERARRGFAVDGFDVDGLRRSVAVVAKYDALSDDDLFARFAR